MIGVDHRDMQKQREKLIELFIIYHKKRGHEVTLVFDGWKGGHGREARTVTGGITVIYSGLGERADDVIKRIISKRQKKWAVVSSDREVENAAWKHSCVPVGSEYFYGVVTRSVNDEGERTDDKYDSWYSEEECHMPAKGNPRQLSKKQKEIRRVIEKM